MADYCIIGNGLLATALKSKVDYSWYPTKDTKVIFYFGGVKHMDFEKNPDYHTRHINLEFVFLLHYCKENSIKLIYPSSALIYEKDTWFTKQKLNMEKMASEQENTLGLRIFPVYGENSQTVINEWCRAIKSDIQPIIWGDGTQTRDFIYIDDFVNQVLQSVDKTGIIEIGTGISHSFNEIVATINKVLGKNIKPIYKEAPEGYSKGIKCEKPLPTKISLEEGIKNICSQLS